MNTIENLHCTISMVLLYFQSLNQWQWSNVFVCGCVYEQSNMRGTTKETYNGTRERKQLKKNCHQKIMQTNTVEAVDVFNVWPAGAKKHTLSHDHRLHEIKIIWMQYHSIICSSRLTRHSFPCGFDRVKSEQKPLIPPFFLSLQKHIEFNSCSIFLFLLSLCPRLFDLHPP